MNPERFSRCVVFVHGLGRFKTSMQAMETAFKADGYTTINWAAYPSTAIDITTAAERLYEVVQLNSGKQEKLHFVTHSLGGILVRRMIRLHGEENVGAIVMLAPPNQGSAAARFLLENPILKFFLGPAGQELKDQGHLDEICAIPSQNVCVIAGTRGDDLRNPAVLVGTGFVLVPPHDGTVTVEETRLPRMAKHVPVDACHTLIASQQAVIDEALAFIGSVASAAQTQQMPSPNQGNEPMNPYECVRVGLGMIAQNPVVLDQLDKLPTAAGRTLGGPLWWRDLANVHRWRIQQNTVFENCRLLDPQNTRRAWWGSKKGMLDAFVKLSRQQSSPVAEEEAAGAAVLLKIDPKHVPQMLKELAELRDSGVITEAEFQEKKNKLLNLI
jgi:pimeloyl-ACP methyl ester carboxylesterase